MLEVVISFIGRKRGEVSVGVDKKRSLKVSWSRKGYELVEFSGNFKEFFDFNSFSRKKGVLIL